MKNTTPPKLTDEEIRSRREGRRNWYGPLADDNVEHVLFRMRNLLKGQYYTVVTNNADYDFAMPGVKVSQFIVPFTTTGGEKSDGFRIHRIGDAYTFYTEDEDKTWTTCGINIHDSYGSYGISSHFLTERDAYEAYRSSEMDVRRWVTYLNIEGGLSDDPDQFGSQDRIEISQYNLVSPAQQLQWVFAPERHWSDHGPDQYKAK